MSLHHSPQIALAKAVFGLLVCVSLIPSNWSLAEDAAWPDDRIIPHFAEPAKELDAIERQSLSEDERITFSSLQGHVNSRQPRLILLDRRAEEGRDTWAETSTIQLGSRNIHSRDERFDLLRKYADEIRGIVLYDPRKSSHYRNLAGTVAGLEDAIPVSIEVRDDLVANDIDLPIVEDLTNLTLESAVEIYQHLYSTYWPRCTKRLILSARPSRRGDHDHTRDIAAAAKSAVIWLDARRPDERQLLRQFYGDMTAGNSVALGWHPSERSGITTASEFGIGTLPSDHFVSASVFAGVQSEIEVPVIAPSTTLDPKAYIAIFISDGDNIQYNQHAMRKIWDRSQTVRGKLPLTWTISPALVDIAPGMLNYYYRTATPADCFAAGPSGLGYLMPVNTLEEDGAPLGVQTPTEQLDGYTRLTERYLQRSGLSLVTIWDNLTAEQREIYERNCPSLLGVTVQNFRDDPTVESSIVQDRLRFEKLVVPYCTTEEHLKRTIARRMDRWDRNQPTFMAIQINIWKELQPERLLKIATDLRTLHGDDIEFVRADHFFQLRQQVQRN